MINWWLCDLIWFDSGNNYIQQHQNYIIKKINIHNQSVWQ